MLSITLSVLVVFISEIEVDGVRMHLWHVLIEAGSRWKELIPEIHLNLRLSEGIPLRFLRLDFFHRCLYGFIRVKLGIWASRLCQLLGGCIRLRICRTVGFGVLLPAFLFNFGAWDDNLGVKVGIGIICDLVSWWCIINMMSPKKDYEG